MQNTASKAVERASASAETMAKQFGATIADVLDRLEGKQSSVKLSFENLTLETGYVNGSVNGAVVLTLNHAHE